MDGVGEQVRLLGYADRLSVAPGGRIEFKVSSELPEFTPSLVRLRRGGSPMHECDLLEEEVAADLPTTVPGRVQVARTGSYVEAALRPDAEVSGVGLAVWMCPTRLDRDREQTVLALAGRLTAVPPAVSDPWSATAVLAGSRPSASALTPSVPSTATASSPAASRPVASADQPVGATTGRARRPLKNPPREPAPTRSTQVPVA